MGERNVWRWDEPEAKLCWFTKCRAKACGWESDFIEFRGDITFSECPTCGCDDLDDESEYV